MIDNSLHLQVLFFSILMVKHIINAGVIISMVRFSRSYDERDTSINIQQNEKMIQDKSNQHLTLEDVCPKWSKRLELGLDEKDKHIMACDSKYCLVGEAWGFTGKHAGYYIAPLIPFIGCWRCVQYGNEMGKLARKTAVTA